MKRPLAQKLSAIIGAVLVAFALIIALVFFSIYRTNSIQIQQDQLRSRAQVIAQTIGELRGSVGLAGQVHEAGKGGGYGAYLRFISDIAGVSAWVVDTKLTVVSEDATRAVEATKSLPVGLSNLAKEALTNKVVVHKQSEGLLSDPILSISAPILSSDGTVMGAVVMRTLGQGTQGAIRSSFIILIVSIGIALIVSLLLSVRLSGWLVAPLVNMTRHATAMAQGDYSPVVPTLSEDEVGELSLALATLATTLDEAERRSAQLDTMRAQFISNVSHELRTPLTVMRGSIEALRDNVVTSPEKVAEFYQQLLEETRHLERLVSDLFELTKMEDPGFVIVREPMDVREVVIDVARSAQTLGAGKAIRVETEISPRVHVIEGDYGRFRQMILTLIDNAIKYSPEGSVVRLVYTGDSVSVVDEGPGLDADEIAQLFDRFYRTRYGVEAAGTGLGLSIAKQIALRHQSSITVLSDGKHGSTFTVDFTQN